MPARPPDTSFAARATRERLHTFLAARLSSETDAAAVLAHLPAALRWADTLPANASLVVRWQQILRHAIVEHVRSGVTASARERAWQAIVALSHAQHRPALAGCLAPFVSELPLDQAVLLHHVEILGQPRDTAARELGHAPADAALLLARAENQLRSRLEKLFAAAAAPDRPLPPPREISRHRLAQLRADRRLGRPAPPLAATP